MPTPRMSVAGSRPWNPSRFQQSSLRGGWGPPKV
eukprot:CAMPEP_0114166336 /NCGR_PEP_ID=MMETSP0043_2-20121206/31776_1 /TAXON_ID=464988 /ORGANISM="Hemiselmis andersenii, Strain CCMP644" /LENGTH=33 /DNA_ID= /DNA_START= /DNA_END= /DNA_ORIENTATION=